MNIFDVLKALKKGYYYNVPLNPLQFKDKHAVANHHHASGHLVELRNMLVKSGHKVEFEMEPAKDVPVWDKDKNKMVLTPVVKINIEIKRN